MSRQVDVSRRNRGDRDIILGNGQRNIRAGKHRRIIDCDNGERDVLQCRRRATATGVALIVDCDLQIIGARKVGVTAINQAIHCTIDRRQAATKTHGRIIAAGTHGKGQAGRAGQRQTALCNRQHDCQRAAASIDICQRNRIGTRKHQVAVFINRLCSRCRNGGRIVDTTDRNRDRSDCGLRAAATTIALVIKCELQAIGAAVVVGAQIAKAVKCCVDCGQCAAKGHRRVAQTITGREGQTGDTG